jgi:hypothetical protein
MRHGCFLFAAILLALCGGAQAQTKTQPSTANLLTPCGVNVPWVGGAGGAGTNGACWSTGALGSIAHVGLGTSVANPGTGNAETLLPIQTATGASKTFGTADMFQETRRSNAGSAMTDTFPASSATGLVNGTKITVVNADASASDTITAGAGTTINSSATDVVTFGRAIQYVYDLANTTWRRTLNTGSALLAQNNLSELASASSARTNLGLGTAAVANTGTSGATIPLLNGNNTWSGTNALANTTIGAGSAITSSGPGGALASGAFAAAYSLPTATSSTPGGVKPDGTTIANSAGAISVAYGTSANTAAQGNDSRITGAAQQTTGTWTPADASGASLTFTGVSAGYTRIGNMVFAYATLTYPATASTAATSISGFPVNAAAAAYSQQCAVSYTSAAASKLMVMANNTTTAQLYSIGGAAATNALMTGAQLFFTCIYPSS